VTLFGNVRIVAGARHSRRQHGREGHVPEGFRIATYNIENLDDQIEDFDARLAALRPMLARIDADILCLQEVDAQPRNRAPRTPRALKRLIETTAFESFHLACSEPEPGHGPMDKHNLAVLSRFPIIQQRSLRHVLVPPPAHGLPIEAGTAMGKPPRGGAVWDRPLQHVTIELADARKLEIVNLHLRAPMANHIKGGTLAPQVWRGTRAWAEGFYVSSLKRIGQALEARLLVEQLFDADPAALIVVAGDFNAETLEMPTRLLRADVIDTGNELLSRRRLEPVEARVPAERRFSVRYGARRAMVDHLLVSPPLIEAVQQVEILNEDLPDEETAARLGEPAAGSYHAPLVARFSL
jgi:endonuclease/exonuclease/phosphatase family metal-dependent hydrolase